MNEEILELKRRAIELKNAGDIEGAKQLLGQARQLEFESISIDELDDPKKLQQLALALKQKGDLDGARTALLKSKRIQQEREQQQQHVQQQVYDHQQQHEQHEQQQQEEERQREEQHEQEQQEHHKQQQHHEQQQIDDSSEQKGTQEQSGTNDQTNDDATTTAGTNKIPADHSAEAPSPSSPPRPPPPTASVDTGTQSASSTPAPPTTDNADVGEKDGDVDSVIGEGGDDDGGGGGEDDDDVEDEEGLLAELTGEGGGNDEEEFLELDPTSVTYSIEEMVDEEMMSEFKIGGMPVPSNEVYQQKVLEMKKLALSCKQSGQIQQAMQYLQQSKQLEKVRVALSQMIPGDLGLRINDDEDGWIEGLNEDESNLILGEAYGIEQAKQRHNTHSNNQPTPLDLEDLDSLDAATLLEMIDMNMVILPSIEDVLRQAQEKKAAAVHHKAGGDIESAKIALRQSKEFQAAATKLETLIQEMEQLKKQRGKHNDSDPDVDAVLAETGEGISEEALEALLNGSAVASETTTKAPTINKQQHRQPPPKPKPKTKTSEELKLEAVRLRNEGNMAEATKVFKLYKETLQKEAIEKEQQQCQDMIVALQNEVLMAHQQQRLYLFYQRFVDTKIGNELLTRWCDYEKRCGQVIKLIQHKKSMQGITIVRKKSNLLLQLDPNDVPKFVQKGIDPTDERLEVSILDVRNLHENKTMQKVLKKLHHDKKDTATNLGTIQVTMTIQLPPSEAESDKSIELVFESSNQILENNSTSQGDAASGGAAAAAAPVYLFKGSQFVDLPVRGDSKFATKLLQRMERRRIQIAVHYISMEEQQQQQQQQANKKGGGGWFWASSKDKDTGGDHSENEDDQHNHHGIVLGKVALELRELLNGTCICGDYQLTSGGSTRTCGGTLAFCIRTGASVPFDPTAVLIANVERETEAEQQQQQEGQPQRHNVMTPYANAFSFMVAAPDTGDCTANDAKS